MRMETGRKKVKDISITTEPNTGKTKKQTGAFPSRSILPHFVSALPAHERHVQQISLKAKTNSPHRTADYYRASRRYRCDARSARTEGSHRLQHANQNRSEER